MRVGHAREFPVDERAFLMTITRQCAVAIERLRLIASERELRVSAEVLAAGMARMQELASDLSLAIDLVDVARVLVDKGRAAVGACNAGIWIIEGETAVLLGQHGYAPAAAEAFARVAFQREHTALCRALARGHPVFIEGRDGDRGGTTSSWRAHST